MSCSRSCRRFNREKQARRSCAAHVVLSIVSPFISPQAISFLTPLAVIFVVKIIQRTDRTEIKEACLGMGGQLPGMLVLICTRSIYFFLLAYRGSFLSSFSSVGPSRKCFASMRLTLQLSDQLVKAGRVPHPPVQSQAADAQLLQITCHLFHSQISWHHPPSAAELQPRRLPRSPEALAHRRALRTFSTNPIGATQ